ncbi:MAG: archaeal heat shock protein Hsp20 [Candidatus Bathyarchaeia archaeon]
MTEDESFTSWFRKWWRRTPFFSGLFDELDRMLGEVFVWALSDVPKSLIREKVLPDGSKIREVGPIVYGYSVIVGPDGKPQIREFGNVKPSLEPTPLGLSRPKLKVSEQREPLVEVIEDASTISVVAELPGVEKKDIDLTCTERLLSISADTEARKYFKELKLPAEVDPKSAKAKYRNGVLEVILNKSKPKPAGERISIE